LCDTAFSQSGSLDIRAETLVEHSGTSSQEKPFKCRECDKAFSLLGHLNSHMTVHTGDADEPYKCHVCDTAFSQSGHLKNHISHVHV